LVELAIGKIVQVMNPTKMMMVDRFWEEKDSSGCE
jgi:hypothetical protein